MKRAGLVVAVVVALALPGTAGAGTSRFSGHVKGGGKVSFRVKTRNDHAFVRDLSFVNVAATCEGGAGKVSVNLFGRIPVEPDGEFHAIGSGDGGATHSRISGEFKAGGKRARGKVRLYGNFNDGQGGTVKCNTGTRIWHAR
jgi:hypothetical protein